MGIMNKHWEFPFLFSLEFSGIPNLYKTDEGCTCRQPRTLEDFRFAKKENKVGSPYIQNPPTL